MTPSKLRTSALSDPGLKRATNQDSHAIWVPEDPDERARRGVLMVLADGMGGAKAGEVASHIAVETVLNSYRDAPAEDPLPDLENALECANREVFSAGVAHPEWSGMATTCTAMVVKDRDVWVAHVGDSRAYLVRDGAIHRLTEDHSLVAAMVRRHEISAEAARSDQRRNVVTRGIGLQEHLEADVGRIDALLEPGDTLILCSDGLHGQVSDDELAGVAAAPDVERVCSELITIANRRGGPDNITVIAARLDGPPSGSFRLPPPEGPPTLEARTRRSSRTPLLILLLALSAALLALIWRMRGSR